MATQTLPSLPSISRTSYSSKSRSTDHSGRLASSTNSRDSSVADNRRDCLTSLSALYKSTYKPYQFTHMYGTKYKHDFQGRYITPPLPERQFTARYAPMNYSSLKTTYQQEFQERESLGKPLVVPSSRNRNHRPHPRLTNTWQYPNSHRWIWSHTDLEKSHHGGSHEKQRVTKSAGFYDDKTEIFRTHRWCSR